MPSHRDETERGSNREQAGAREIAGDGSSMLVFFFCVPLNDGVVTQFCEFVFKMSVSTLFLDQLEKFRREWTRVVCKYLILHSNKYAKGISCKLHSVM